MPHYKAAHIREQGQDMIIFPLAAAFGSQPLSVQEQELAVLQYGVRSAGLPGSAVAVWQDGSGRTRFLGPTAWHGFLQGLTYQTVWAIVNKEISW